MDPQAAQVDWIMNGQGGGSVAAALLRSNGDVNVLRPYLGKDGNSYITVNEQGKWVAKKVLVSNAPTSLPLDSWKLIDDTVVEIAKPRLRAVGDLRSAGLQVIIPNGMRYTVYTHQNISDISGASISMDGMRRSERDRPLFDTANLPLPIIHKDCSFSLREVLASRNGGPPIDTTTLSLAAEKVAEGAEKLLLGTWPTYTYGGGTVYGYTNYPNRITYTITVPTAGGWTGQTLLNELLAMRALAYAKHMYGPFMVYVSPNWDQYLDDDYVAAAGSESIRTRVSKVEGIRGIRTLDYLSDITPTAFTILMVQMSPGTVREVIGMDITTLQWPSGDGLELNYKVMCIMVPQLRNDQNLQCGIVHGSVAA